MVDLKLPIVVDGHVHVTNRVFWEGINPFDPQDFGFDFARAIASGVNVVIENIAPYGYANFNYSVKQTFRLIETFYQMLERNADRAALATSATQARAIVKSGRLAVFLGIESGFDHEGDLTILHVLHRLGLRVVQFATQTCFNAFADAETGGPPIWNGVNCRGRKLVREMNDLGIMIDITHATPQAQAQLIEFSTAPVVASHVAMASVAGAGLTDDLLTALAAKGGMVGVIGASAAISSAYREWLTAHPHQAVQSTAPVMDMINFVSPMTPKSQNHGEFGEWLDQEMRTRHLRAFRPWVEFPEALRFVPTADQWAEHVNHVVRAVGIKHVGIGLDLVGGRSCTPINAAGYRDLVAALRKTLPEDAVQKVAGENWLRVIDLVMS